MKEQEVFFEGGGGGQHKIKKNKDVSWKKDSD